MRRNLDWQGIVFLSIGLSTLQYVLEEGNRNDWFDSRLITGACIVSAASLLAFIYQELTAPAPAVNLRLFRDPVFASATVIGSVMFSNLMANMFMLPVYMQELLGFTALKSGITLVPRALVMMVATPIVGRLYGRVSPRVLIAIGVACVALGSLDMGGFTLQTSDTGIIRTLLLQGIGFSCLFVPLTTVALSYVPRVQLADGTGLNSVCRQFGGSAGLAIYGTLLTQFATQARAGLAAHLDASRPDVMQRLSAISAGMMRHGMDERSARAAALAVLNGQVARQSAMIAFERIFILTGAVMLLLLPLVFVLRDKAHHEDGGRTGARAAG
jgi:DHA2 family multidrug resistance protein